MTGITSITRDYGINPSIVRIQTTDILATVGAANYITSQYANIYSINSGVFQWVASDSVLVYAADGSGLYTINNSYTSLLEIATTAGGSGVNSITAGTGLSGGTITSSGTIALASIASNTILANITGGSAVPIPNTLTAIIDSSMGSTQGQILYRNNTAWVVLAPGTAGFFLATGGASANPSWVAQSTPTGMALTEVNDTNVTLTLGGSPATALLAAASLTLGWTGTLAGSRGGTGINNGVNTATYAGNLNFAGAFSTVGAFSVIQTYTGATNVTFPTSGTLATTSQIPTGAALTAANDTNVTLTLGGSPSTALVNAASLTLGWTGQLGFTRGGTNASLTASNGGIVYSTATAMAILSGTATAGQMLQSGATAAPTWSTTTWPATSTSGRLLFSTANNVVGELTTTASSILTSSAGGIPQWSLATGFANAPVNTNITSMTGLTGTLQYPTGVVDSNGNLIMQWSFLASAVNYWRFYNAASGGAPQAQVQGSDSAIPINFGTKNSNFYLQDFTNTIAPALRFYNAAATHFTAFKVATTQATDVTFVLPAADGSSGDYLKTDGSGNLTFSSKIPINGISVQRITASGAGTYTPTTGMQYVIVRSQSAGAGAGGAATTTTGNVSAGAPGGGGEYIEALFTAAQIGASKPYVVGAKGAGGAAGNNAGSNGGNTTFNTNWIITIGGTGGVGGASATGVSGFLNDSGAPGTGGSVSTGTLIRQIAGGVGTTAFALGTQSRGGIGGSSGCGGSGGQAGIASAGTAAAANSGAGGGGAATQAQTAAAGGNGADGFLEFIEYLST